MDNENASSPPRRDQFEHRKDFVRAYDRWRDKNLPNRKARKRPEGYQAAQYAKHQEKRLAAKKELYETKRAMLLERQAKWRDGNRDKLKARDDRRYREDRARFYANNWLRRRVMAAAAPPWLTREQWEAIADVYEQAREMTKMTGIPHVVDHIWPLRGKRSCGLHVPWNLQVLTAAVNKKKNNSEPDDG